jgi:hypothetical protein
MIYNAGLVRNLRLFRSRFVQKIAKIPPIANQDEACRERQKARRGGHFEI